MRRSPEPPVPRRPEKSTGNADAATEYRGSKPTPTRISARTRLGTIFGIESMLSFVAKSVATFCGIGNYSGRPHTIFDGNIPSPSTRMQIGR